MPTIFFNKLARRPLPKFNFQPDIQPVSPNLLHLTRLFNDSKSCSCFSSASSASMYFTLEPPTDVTSSIARRAFSVRGYPINGSNCVTTSISRARSLPTFRFAASSRRPIRYSEKILESNVSAGSCSWLTGGLRSSVQGVLRNVFTPPGTTSYRTHRLATRGGTGCKRWNPFNRRVSAWCRLTQQIKE